MNILFLTHTFPYPLNDGVRLHIYHLLRELAPRHRLSLLCLNDVPVSDEERRAVESLGLRVAGVLRHDVPRSLPRRMANTFFDCAPFLVRQFESKPLRALLRRLLPELKPDVVHVDYLSMAAYRDEFASVPAVFFPHDAVSMLFERNVASETDLSRKLYTFLQWKKIKRFEMRWIPRFQATMVVSPVDREYLLRHCPGAEIAVSPNGVDMDYFSPRPGREEPGLILFRGVMNFLPNADAARFFYREIFPLVRREVPEARFCVAGKEPPQDLLDAAKRDPGLIVTGYVEDLRDWTARAAVVACPMRIGSGIKNKILESMAMARPVVATPMACAGIEAAPGEHLFLEADPAAFAGRVVFLLRDPQARSEMGTRALAFVRERHAWRRNAEDFEKLYKKAAGLG